MPLAPMAIVTCHALESPTKDPSPKSGVSKPGGSERIGRTPPARCPLRLGPPEHCRDRLRPRRRRRKPCTARPEPHSRPDLLSRGRVLDEVHLKAPAAHPVDSPRIDDSWRRWIPRASAFTTWIPPGESGQWHPMIGPGCWSRRPHPMASRRRLWNTGARAAREADASAYAPSPGANRSCPPNYPVASTVWRSHPMASGSTRRSTITRSAKVAGPFRTCAFSPDGR